MALLTCTFRTKFGVQDLKGWPGVDPTSTSQQGLRAPLEIRGIMRYTSRAAFFMALLSLLATLITWGRQFEVKNWVFHAGLRPS